ncbi:MAG: UTP--glucose-1-phosphate uridylyltransferase [Planctomycetota bacterium]|jgi:UDP-N-acetylglucosamine/UDP-N-acetylgalactosamine diphosphorylase
MTIFSKKLAQLTSDLITQGERVTDMVLRAVEAYFDIDHAKAATVVEGDSVIDRVDVEIERASIGLLRMGETDEHSIRSVLTIVKINNEMERIADCAVNMAEVVAECVERKHPVPPTFRVMANSVIGMLRDANRALAEADSVLVRGPLRLPAADRHPVARAHRRSLHEHLRAGDLPRDGPGRPPPAGGMDQARASGRLRRAGGAAREGQQHVSQHDAPTTPAVETDRLAAVRKTLETHGQAHLVGTWERLDERQRLALLDQLRQIDFAAVDALVESHVRARPEFETPGDLEPAIVYPYDAGSPEAAARFRAAGESLIREGRVAAFTVAGGQGTRLGWNGPKGTYPGTPVTGKPLFRVFAEQILATQRRYGVTIPWYIMTSPMNDAQTRAFIVDNNCFGLRRQDIFMFPQGVMPSIDAVTGRLLLADEHTVALNPDGHGGSIRALRTSGAVEDMRARGIEHISYFQVDNPLVRAIDPLFIGLHATAPDSSAQMSSKSVPKTEPGEKVGVLCRGGGRTMVIEYSVLPESLAVQREDDGRLRFRAGNMAVHVLGLSFVEELTPAGAPFALPWHRADKAVAFHDPETGRNVEPDGPNAVKLETFVFDALPLAESSIVFETSRAEEFAPIKNREGADSARTSYEMQFDRNGAWLEQHGVRVPRDADGHVSARIEISPLTALEAADLAGVNLPASVAAGAALTL